MLALMRSVGAIVLGVLVFFAVVLVCDRVIYLVWPSAVTPDHAHVVSLAALWVMLLYWLLGVMAAGLVAALVAGRRQVAYARATGFILLMFFAVNVWTTWGTEDPSWWHLLLLLAVLPVCSVGAKLVPAVARAASVAGGA
jgi:hypothetical protein